MKEKLQRTVEVTPAFDKRHSDPEKNYGVHGAEMRFLVKGKHGAVQILIFTNWHLPEVQKELINKCSPEMYREYKFCILKPMAADLGYHSYKPHYEGQKTITENCSILGGKPCYYGGSGLNAEPVFERLIREGHEAMWKELEAYYYRIFEEN